MKNSERTACQATNFPKKTRRHLVAILLLIAGVFILACNKDEFLSKKTSSSLVVPTRLEELRGLLDFEYVSYQTPLLGILSADEYYLKYPDWQAEGAMVRNAYIWATDIYAGESFAMVNDWDVPFKQILVANVVLAGVEQISPTSQEQSDWRFTKGAAHFLRAKALFSLAEVFCMPYDHRTAGADPGLPLRLSPDINDHVQRADLESTYQQILNDLHQAKALLDFDGVTANKLRPTKLAAFALLSRIYFSQRNYELAGAYADSVLTRYDKLMDFNGVTWFTLANEELIYHNVTTSGILLISTASGSLHVDSSLYALYDENDLRKTTYFRVVNGSRVALNNTYSTLNFPFTGLATDEIYLIRAEVHARDNQLAAAASLINKLLAKRFLPGTHQPVSYTSKEEALQAVLTERRKELVFRGARWSDIRRLNKEGYGIILTRNLNGTVYTLPPNDPRYALNIPGYEINLSGIEQNVR